MVVTLPARRLWAKLGSNTYPCNYHSLLAHLTDVGGVARILLDSHAPRAVRPRLARELGVPEGAVGSWVALWAAAHDIGKAIPGFQFRDNSTVLKSELEPHGFTAGGGQAPPHAFASAAILKAWLVGERAFHPSLASRVAYAIGGHHGLFPNTLPESRHDLGEGPWAVVQAELLDALADQFGVPADPPTGGTGRDQSVWLYLAGLVTVADWIASNEDFFPWEREPAADYGTKSAERAGEALKKIRWPKPTPPAPPQCFAEVFPKWPPRPLQTACEAVARSLAGPALVLVEAPMGEGKTEAALYVADWWRRRTGGGAYVALPTMATSNGLFPRVRDFLAATVPGWAELHLLHGQAILSDTYQELKNLGAVYDDGDATGVAAHEWFAKDKKQALLAPYGVGTIDQALLAVVQTKHFFLRLFGLAGKTVILDEVHAYDVYMSTLMELLLKWLAALGCPVVLLSATLPKDRRRALVQAYTGGDVDLPDVSYPRVTIAAPGGEIVCRHVEAEKSRDRAIALDRIAEANLAVELTTALAEGGCACVIRNTVGLAQETYRTLKAAFAGTGIRVLLFHARFLFGRRQHIEKLVLRLFGNGKLRVKKMKVVLVATQVVEQSLDLDFDLMATDVAPVDLVLQRSGRLHRHGGRTRPAAVAKPRLLLIEPGEKDGRPDFGNSEFVYGRYVLLRSWEVLQPKQMLNVPQEIEPLVEAVYSTRVERDNDFRDSLKDMQKKIMSQKSAASQVLVKPPDDEDEILIESVKGLSEDDDPRTHASRRAATRDIEPSVQLVVARVQDGIDCIRDKKALRPLKKGQPDLEEMKAVLENVVTVTRSQCVAYYAARGPEPTWAKSGILKHVRLARVGMDGRSMPGEFVMTVDDEVGLIFSHDDCEVV